MTSDVLMSDKREFELLNVVKDNFQCYSVTIQNENQMVMSIYALREMPGIIL